LGCQYYIRLFVGQVATSTALAALDVCQTSFLNSKRGTDRQVSRLFYAALVGPGETQGLGHEVLGGKVIDRNYLAVIIGSKSIDFMPQEGSSK
jgi:hypothetical protein